MADISFGPVKIRKPLRILYNVFQPQAEYLAAGRACRVVVKPCNKKARLRAGLSIKA
jgi:hypothetical protein